MFECILQLNLTENFEHWFTFYNIYLLDALFWNTESPVTGSENVMMHSQPPTSSPWMGNVTWPSKRPFPQSFTFDITVWRAWPPVTAANRKQSVLIIILVCCSAIRQGKCELHNLTKIKKNSREPPGQFQPKLAKSILGWKELKFVQMKGHPLFFRRDNYNKKVILV